MKYVELAQGEDARQRIARGVEKLTNTVGATLGPSGRNVIIEQSSGNPISTKDGVTVAKAIHLADKFEDIGVQVVKQASIKTGEQAGDGTTTSTILAGKLYSLATKAVKNDKINTVDVRRGIEKGGNLVASFLEEISRNITSEDEIKAVAAISGNNDPQVGEVVALAVNNSGIEGVVTVEESRTGETYLETVEGIEFNRGFLSPHFVTDTKSMSTTLDNPVILITSEKVNISKDILPLLEMCSSQSKSLVIIAEDVGPEVLSILVVNKLRGTLQTVAVKAPDFGDRKKQTLEDIAILTGGTVVSKEKGMLLSKIDTNWLGKSRKVVVDKDSTIIIDGAGQEEEIVKRVEELKSQIEEVTSPYEVENLQKRLGRLVGGVGVIHVGGYTEVELRERKDRIEDALHATRAALEEGILPGGGVALLRASKFLSEGGKDIVRLESTSEQLGYEILIEALQSPIESILNNSIGEPATVEGILQVIKVDSNMWFGYNPRILEFVDLYDSGIVDPKKVTRLALENAISVAGTLLTTEAVIALDREQTDPPIQASPYSSLEM